MATTSGFYPTKGTEVVPKLVPKTQLVNVILGEAKEAIPLADTTGWIVTVGKVTINPALSYEANNLCGEVVLDWGPTEGGGGAYHA